MKTFGLQDAVDSAQKSLQRWHHVYQNGAGDPFWPDGMNLNLIRNHIMYYSEMAKEMYQKGEQVSLFDTGEGGRGAIHVPPLVDNDYMALGKPHPRYAITGDNNGQG